MVDYQITTLSASDHDALVRLWRAAELPYHPNGRDSHEALLAQMRLPNCRFLAIWGDDGELAASAIATHEGRKGWINRLAVRPAVRRTGMARALIGACESWLGSQGIGLYAALVEGDNLSSQALFAACDYVRDDSLVYFRKVTRPDI